MKTVNKGQICSVAGCHRAAVKRSWCGTHYRRWFVHGDVNTLLKAANGDGFYESGYKGHQINGVKKFEHVAIAEKALGRPLPAGAVVHHADQNRKNNVPSNLVICPDRAYHVLVHQRLRALLESGDANNFRCRHCGGYEHQDGMAHYETKRGSGLYVHEHKVCRNARHVTRNALKRAATASTFQSTTESEGVL